MGRESDVGRLGGGLIAAAIGLSEHRSPLDAYLKITGEDDSVLESEDIDRGNFLEPALRSWHGRKVGAVVVEQPGTLRHPTLPWASYTPDGIVQLAPASVPFVDLPERVLAEYKSPGYEQSLKYGNPGTDEVPRDVFLQVAWGMFVTNLDRSHVAALIDGQLQVFEIKRELSLEQEIVDRARFFMERYVATKTPPPATYSERDTAWVKKRWPKNDAKKVIQWAELGTEARALVTRYVELYRSVKADEKELQALENAVKVDVVQDAISLEGDSDAPFKRITWKNNETAGPQWKAVAEAMIASGTVPDDPSALIAKFTPTPPRVFRPWFEKEKK